MSGRTRGKVGGIRTLAQCAFALEAGRRLSHSILPTVCSLSPAFARSALRCRTGFRNLSCAPHPDCVPRANSPLRGNSALAYIIGHR